MNKEAEAWIKEMSELKSSLNQPHIKKIIKERINLPEWEDFKIGGNEEFHLIDMIFLFRDIGYHVEYELGDGYAIIGQKRRTN